MATTPFRSESSFFEPMAQPGDENKQEISQYSTWLSSQFRRIPFLFYFSWLILIFVINLYCAYVFLGDIFKQYLDPFFIIRNLHLMEVSLSTGILFFLYGCGEMFYSIKTKNSRIAQQSIGKFQYNFVGAAISLIFTLLADIKIFPLEFLLYFLITPIIHLIGGHFVLKIFKQNHPLVRRATSQAAEDIDEDFFEQNETVSSEITKYNQQLKTWSYFVYQNWLKFAVMFEITIAIGHFLFSLVKEIDREASQPLVMVAYGILVLLSFLNSYSCFELEVATRTRNLQRSEKAIFLLKICSGLSLMASLFVRIEMEYRFSLFKSSNITLSYLLWFACVFLVPLTSLLGGLKVRKILEQRENFVRVSSFTEKYYL